MSHRRNTQGILAPSAAASPSATFAATLREQVIQQMRTTHDAAHDAPAVMSSPATVVPTEDGDVVIADLTDNLTDVVATAQRLRALVRAEGSRIERHA